MQADHASTTRRALFAATTVFPVAAVASRAPTIKTGGHTLYPAETPSEESDWVGFISMLALLHPNGRETAVHAFKAGMRLKDLCVVDLGIMRTRGYLPTLMFEVGAEFRTFTAQGER